MSTALYDALERAVKVLQAHPELAPSITVSMAEDGLWVAPYIAGAPMTALLTWNDALRDVERDFESTTGPDKSYSYTKVTIRGFLEDVPVVAQSVTFQDVQGTRGRISLAELKRVAKTEEPLFPEPR